MKKYLIYIIQALIIVLFLLAWFFAPTGRCVSQKRVEKIELKGKVLNKYRNKNEHLYPTLEMSNASNKIVITIDKSRFYDFVEIGDSLIKERGSLDIRLIRNGLDTIFTIDYGCDK